MTVSRNSGDGQRLEPSEEGAGGIGLTRMDAGHHPWDAFMPGLAVVIASIAPISLAYAGPSVCHNGPRDKLPTGRLGTKPARPWT